MSEETPLARLAKRVGIAEGYHDVWGAYHPTSDATRRALLAAMGIPVSSDAAIEAALRAQEARTWQRLLPAVQVIKQSALPARVAVRLPAGMAPQELAWRFIEENGAEHSGIFRSTDLAEIERHTFEGESFSASMLSIPLPLPLGYHRLALCRADATLATTALIVTPDRCYTPPALAAGGRVFGPALQLYALRSERNWGIGDFTDFKQMVDLWAEAGSIIIGCNPLNALFPHNPLHKSPYSPSSRLFLNVLYLDVEAIADFQECEPAQMRVRSPGFQARVQALRAAELVDYAEVAAAKLAILELLYRHFCEHHLAYDTERARAFRAFESQEGRPLYLHAVFEALQEHFHREDMSIWGWPVWPPAYRDPESGAVKRFAVSNNTRVQYFQYLQWQADLQLGAVGRCCRELGLGVGLYLDLPVSVDPAGTEAWANQSLYALDARIGAPPDEHSPHGQDWGLPPFNPQALCEAAYAPFIAILRHNARHAGALRIDHVMGLMRLFWVHREGGKTTGAYVHYPFEDLLGILALESHRNRCLIIGEDLGTVPEEVRVALGHLGVLSYRLLYFEKDEGGDFRPPHEYPAQALVAVGTHDLPTLAGYWQGHDLRMRAELGLYPSDAVKQASIVSRSQDRARLLLALEREGLLPEGVSVDPAGCPTLTRDLCGAFHAFLAASPAQVMMVQLEDILGQIEQVNLPTTTDQYPNWCRKLQAVIEHLGSDPRFIALSVALREMRSGAPPGVPGPTEAATERARPAIPIPCATYRLQFNYAFTFSAATALVPYLSELGVSHGYASPLLKARPGSLHGYDIIAHDELNPEIGSRADFEHLCDTLAVHGMGLILDLVPNHMGVMGSDNAWWLDVLENGPASRFARFFDIDWAPLKEELRGKVLLPILGDRYGSALERGELVLHFDATAGAFFVSYFEHRLPLDPREYPRLLRRRLTVIELQLGPESAALHELKSVITAFEHLPLRADTHPDKIAERHRDKEIHKQRLARLCAAELTIARALEDAVADYNGTPGKPESFQLLHELLEAQPYRIADWHVAFVEINYRRFFDVNDLAALRMEDPEVFNLTHRFVLDLLGVGHVNGLRIDHPDGLYDPAGYFRSLRCRTAEALGARAGGAPSARGIYTIAEKILAAHEHLPEDWSIEGSTGYDFANLLNGLFIDPRGEQPLTRLYHAIVRERVDFDELLYDCKKRIMKHALASELNVLAHQLERIANADWYTRDFTLNELRHALAEIVAWMPVYRTYVSDRQITAADERYVDWAVSRARKRSSAVDTSIFDFIREVLLRRAFKDKDASLQEAVTRFAMQLQQFTAPVMAKGLEDTACYRYHRLLSINEVGGDPRRFCVSLTAFHAANLERAKRWPHALLATSTHDSKRSEDVRARINAISELAEEWREQVRRWSRLNRSRRGRVNGEPVPSRNTEYAIYQTLTGIWPLGDLDDAAYQDFCRRIEGYLIKAAREAKEETNWTSPNAGYEVRLCAFVRALLERSEKNLFLAQFLPFQQRIARLGLFNSLSQTFLKLTVPGVPDLYRGNELWDFSLVDPDNRRPVDYAHRQALLAELKDHMSGTRGRLAAKVRTLVESLEDARIKLYLIWKTLKTRRDHAELFRNGSYVPLSVSGSKSEHVCAFARQCGEETIIAVAPRLYAVLMKDPAALPLGPTVWQDTRIELPDGMVARAGYNVFTAETIPRGSRAWLLSNVLAHCPIALVVVK
ncbi:MAG: malto-oligosyltrehalose synthase [Gammaproteobacteria bacterium]